MSAYILTNGYFKPLGSSPEVSPEDLTKSQTQLVSKRKLIRILCSRSPINSSISAGDLDEVFVRN